MEVASALTFWAKVSSPPGDDHPADRGVAAAARLPGTQVDAVFKLKKATHPLRIHVV